MNRRALFGRVDEGSIKGVSVEFSGNLISADFGVGLGVDIFVGVDGKRNSDLMMLGGCVEPGLDPPENFIWQFMEENKVKASKECSMLTSI